MSRPTFTVGELADHCGGRFTGTPAERAQKVTGVSNIREAGSQSITWIADVKHHNDLLKCQAAAVVGTEALLSNHPRGLIVSDPSEAIATLLDCFDTPMQPPPVGIHPQTWIDPTARIASSARVGAFTVIHAGAVIGENCIIHEGVSIGRDVMIGSDCELYDHVVIYDRSQIGNQVILHSGVVIGADGFGYIFRDGRHRKLAHIGNVVLEDNVEIGPNTVVDRGKLDETRIGRGSKIDALVMIGHNVRIGPLCVLAGQAGLSGSVTLGSGVAVGGQAGFVHGVQIGDQAQIGAQSGIMKDVPQGVTMLGTPAQPLNIQMKGVVLVRRLQKLYDEVAELTRRVHELETAANNRISG